MGLFVGGSPFPVCNDVPPLRPFSGCVPFLGGDHSPVGGHPSFRGRPCLSFCLLLLDVHLFLLIAPRPPFSLSLVLLTPCSLTLK